MKVKVCKCCGHPLPDTGPEMALTPLQRKLFKIVKKAGANGIAVPDIVDSLYADRADGGPLTVRNIICVEARQIRSRLKPFGLAIAATRGPGSRYYLIPQTRLPEFERMSRWTYQRRRAKAREAATHVV